MAIDAEPYSFRLVTPADLELIARWKTQPHVREWWDEPEPFSAADLADPKVVMMIVEWRGRPFAYMQDYDVHGWEGHHFSYLPLHARGIDQFIGEAGMVGQGHGTAFIRQRTAKLFAAGAPVIGTDPHPENARALRAYAKAGFRVAGQAQDTAWGRVVRMEAWAGAENAERRPLGTAVR